MPRKRGRGGSQHALQKGEECEKTRQSCFPLLSLPDELLNHILSYAITVPWHPKNGFHTKAALKNLFISTLHTSRRLRQLTLDLIICKTLWVTISCNQRSIESEINRLHNQIPTLSSSQLSLLPKSRPGLVVSLEGELIDSPANSSCSFVFPYNPYSFALLYAHIFFPSMRYQVSLHMSTVPRSHSSFVHENVVPLFRLANDNNHTIYPLFCALKGGGRRPIDEVMLCTKHLDCSGRFFEASLFALYFSTLESKRRWALPQAGSSARWLSTLLQPDYMSNPKVLQHMRVVRTKNYIARRACLAHISAVKTFGLVFAAAKRGSRSLLAGFHYFDHATWPDLFGLPDYELAETYYIHALLCEIESQWWSSEHAEAMLSTSGHPRAVHENSQNPYEATKCSYIAWRLQKNNIKYAALFKRMSEKNEEACNQLIKTMSAWDSTRLTEIDSISEENVEDPSPVAYLYLDDQRRVFGGPRELCLEWVDIQPDIIMYLHRAKEVAKMVDVSYDERRGEELSALDYEVCNEKQILEDLFGRNDPDTAYKFDNFDIEENDLKNYDEKAELYTTLWENWTP